MVHALQALVPAQLLVTAAGRTHITGPTRDRESPQQIHSLSCADWAIRRCAEREIRSRSVLWPARGKPTCNRRGPPSSCGSAPGPPRYQGCSEQRQHLRGAELLDLIGVAAGAVLPAQRSTPRPARWTRAWWLRRNAPGSGCPRPGGAAAPAACRRSEVQDRPELPEVLELHVRRIVKVDVGLRRTGGDRHPAAGRVKIPRQLDAVLIAPGPAAGSIWPATATG